MKRILCSLAALALGLPLLASAAEGWVVADISLQAGPDTDYPTIAELEAGTPVSIQGCIDGWTWCDVIADEDRGWVPGTFLEEELAGRPVVIIDAGSRIGIPLVSFSIGSYWERHYHNRPFYAERQRFESHTMHAHAAPPRPTQIVATAPRRDAKPRPVSGTASMSGSATAQGTTTTQERSRASAQGTTTTQQRERATAQGTTTTRERDRATAQGTTTQQTQTAQRERDRQRNEQQAQTARTEQPSSDQQRRSAQARSEHPQQQRARPSDAAPQMMPREEHPTAQKPQPQEQRPTQVARNATPPQNERARSSREGPKPKDELKKADNRKKDNNDKDNNGGGR